MIERTSIRGATATPIMPGVDMEAPSSKRRRLIFTNLLSKRTLFRVITSLILLGIIACVALYVLRPPANIDPFTSKVASSVQFSLYYPKVLPAGYRIDPKSVTEPSAGVVIFDLVGPNNQKLYMSEQARPEKLDIGGFYKHFSNLDEEPISGGSITTGKLYGSQSMGGWLSNTVWILCNTKAPISASQMRAMLKSLAVNY